MAVFVAVEASISRRRGGLARLFDFPCEHCSSERFSVCWRCSFARLEVLHARCTVDQEAIALLHQLFRNSYSVVRHVVDDVHIVDFTLVVVFYKSEEFFLKGEICSSIVELDVDQRSRALGVVSRDRSDIEIGDCWRQKLVDLILQVEVSM